MSRTRPPARVELTLWLLVAFIGVNCASLAGAQGFSGQNIKEISLRLSLRLGDSGALPAETKRSAAVKAQRQKTDFGPSEQPVVVAQATYALADFAAAPLINRDQTIAEPSAPRSAFDARGPPLA